MHCGIMVECLSYIKETQTQNVSFVIKRFIVDPLNLKETRASHTVDRYVMEFLVAKKSLVLYVIN